MRQPKSKALSTIVMAAGLGLLTACGAGWEPSERSQREREEAEAARRADSIAGPEGIVFGGTRRRDQTEEQGGGGIGVNSFLWRASLNTVSNLPVASADPFGGVILTDWHAPAEATAERFKINIFILGRQLRADGINVSVFRQVREPSGDWIDAPVGDTTARSIEDTILTRARELRVESAQLQ